MLHVLPGYENRPPSPPHVPDIGIARNVVLELSDRAGREEYLQVCRISLLREAVVMAGCVLHVASP